MSALASSNAFIYVLLAIALVFAVLYAINVFFFKDSEPAEIFVV